MIEIWSNLSKVDLNLRGNNSCKKGFWFDLTLKSYGNQNKIWKKN